MYVRNKVINGLFIHIFISQGAVLPHLAGWVLVLLKLLLATVSASTNGLQNPQPSGSSVFPPGVSSRKPAGLTVSMVTMAQNSP